MGREVRKVPVNWIHPKDIDGRYIPLYENDGRFDRDDRKWTEGWEKWRQGLCEQYGESEKWGLIEPEYKGMRYTDYAGARPNPDDYMPDWDDKEKTHYMMYEDTTEGTPISPAFETPEKLAQWLTDNKASAFGGQTASYEGWLRVANGGFACSMIIGPDGAKTGVDGLTGE